MYDKSELNKALDQAKIAVFLSGDAAFFGALLCNVDFVWTTDSSDVPTAATDGTKIILNEEFFMNLPKDSRKTILMHELDHIARMHMLRAPAGDVEIWNQACDYRINNDLQEQGYSFVGLEAGCLDPTLDHRGKMAEEQIYELLKSKPQMQKSGYSMADLKKPTAGQAQAVIAAVTQATQAAKQSPAGKVPGGVESVLDQFLTPVIPWKEVLQEYMTELLDTYFTWKKPNRRYPDMYLPSRQKRDGCLEHLAYFFDTSGSITNEQVTRFNSEFRYILEEIQPARMTLCQFDTAIHSQQEFEREDSFDFLKVKGRGGTSLVPVYEWIQQNKPTAAVIFSDLECDPMPDPKVPVIWIKIPGYGHTPDYGKVVDLPSD